eukprot:CAMPEP_0119275338 /NCGR_PEP_ID=MMETSP1329-20130426/13604_1 /TAXON_ID=114041 /ORGANISM="Genus nov. species nov., Strain RCC1024" /LENGTH=359 /DNA_ID=CAMNT_0007275715 /DNA_START=134 /DNA_END=1209 /DNA_ORIENTATION=+
MGAQEKKPQQQKHAKILLAGGGIALVVLVYQLNAALLQQDIKRETPGDRQILLASFPKSGSHWARFLVARLADGRRGELNFAQAEALVPDLELGPNRQRFRNDRGLIYKSHQPYREHAIGAAEHRRFGGDPCGGLRVADPFQCLCPNCPGRWRRVLYVVRDGRSALCSYFHFQKALGNFPADGTFGEFLASGKSAYGYAWPRHVESYLDARERGLDVHVLRYEDLKRDPKPTLRALAAWLGVAEPSEARLEQLIEGASLETMKKVEARTGTPLFDALYPAARANGFRLVRDGAVDGFRKCDAVDWNATVPGFADAYARVYGRPPESRALARGLSRARALEAAVAEMVAGLETRLALLTG